MQASARCPAAAYRPAPKRPRTARHDRLIDGGLAGDDHAVDRDALSGKDAEDVSGPNLFGGDDFLFAAQYHARCLRREVQELFNARARLCNGQLLKKAAQPHAAQAANDRRAGQRQQRHILFDAAELQKRLQHFYQLFHVEPLF